MKENVGRVDQIGRFIVGPTLAAVGYARLGGKCGSLPGLIAMMTGALLTETAITRVCPINRLLGLDTRTQRERDRDLEDLLQLREQHPVGIAPRFRADDEPTEPAPAGT